MPRTLAKVTCLITACLFLLMACATSTIRFVGKTVKPDARFYFDCSEKIVALTLDDGPDPDYTEAIVKVLDANDAKATFFVVGEHAKPKFLETIVNSDHELGHHALSEEVLTELSNQSIRDNIDTAHRVISEYATPHWFRPPKGRYNDFIVQYTRNKGYELVLADVYPFDHLISSTAFNFWYVKQFVKKGSIIVLHERNGRGKQTLNTLEKLLPYLKNKGFEIASLSEVATRCSRPISGH